MIFHMRTTLVIDDQVFRQLKKRAAEEGRTLSDLTEEALRRGLAAARPVKPHRRVSLPTFSMGKPCVDLADRNQLFEIFNRD